MKLKEICHFKSYLYFALLLRRWWQYFYVLPVATSYIGTSGDVGTLCHLFDIKLCVELLLELPWVALDLEQLCLTLSCWAAWKFKSCYGRIYGGASSLWCRILAYRVCNEVNRNVPSRHGLWLKVLWGDIHYSKWYEASGQERQQDWLGSLVPLLPQSLPVCPCPQP